MEAEIANLVSLLKQTFERGAWHGPSVTEALEDIQEREAMRRIAGTHSIIELVGHMTAWREYVHQKLQGNASYTVTEETNFPVSTSWPSTLQRLNDSQRDLLVELGRFPGSGLMRQVPGKSTPLNFYTLLHGIVHHDLYHTGQIMLIKRALRAQTI